MARLEKEFSEIASGITPTDNYHARGRKKAECHLPNLLEDVKGIVDCHSQTDPSFKTKRLYTRLSARQVRAELIAQYNYHEAELPTAETIRQKLNQLGYYPRRIAKTQPQKKFPKPMTSLNNYLSLTQLAQEQESTLRLSMDAKATVKIGSFSRGGKVESLHLLATTIFPVLQK